MQKIPKNWVAPYYANVNLSRPPGWTFLSSNHVRVCDGHEYTLSDKLGQGAYGQVFKTISFSGEVLATKTYLPDVKESVILREMRVLLNLKGSSPHLLQYHDAYRTEDGKYFLVTEYIPHSPIYPLFFDLRLEDIKTYMHQLLLAVDTCHRNGIVHADLKPSNILVDPSTKNLKVVDFGHSVFYFPCAAYTSYVGTFAYKAPELLLNWENFHYAADMWAVGRIMLDMLMPHQITLWCGKDRYDQLLKVGELCGSIPLRLLATKYKLMLYELPVMPTRTIPELVYDFNLKQCPTEADQAEQKQRYKTHFTPEGVDLLQRLLTVDPEFRISSGEALDHPFFHGLTKEQ